NVSQQVSSGAALSTTSNVISSSRRNTCAYALAPGGARSSWLCRLPALTFRPFQATITSPAERPASCAGPPSKTCVILASPPTVQRAPSHCLGAESFAVLPLLPPASL